MEWLTSQTLEEMGMCSRVWGVPCPVFSPTLNVVTGGMDITVTELDGIPLT